MSIDEPAVQLRLETWDRPVDAEDLAALDLCRGPTLDVGCGPGRFTAELASRGEVVLGIDIVGGAVALTRDRGGPALQLDVFGALPWEGRWETVLLADGNVGIGGDPAALLRRLGELLVHPGRVVIELAGPGSPHEDGWASIGFADDVWPVRWSRVGVDAIHRIAHSAGLRVTNLLNSGARWWSVLEKQGA